MNDFIQRFRAIAKTYPLQDAISVDNEWQMTYSALELRVVELSQTLLRYGIGPGHLVAIYMAKSPDYLISLLAIWMTGAAFVPIDPTLPDARRQFFLKESKPNLIISQHFKIELRHIDKQYDTHLAYILFTSGSTGQPKGVMITHLGIMNFIDQQIKLFQINSSSRALFYLSTQFDASISVIGTALLSGATLCIVASNTLAEALNLPFILKKNQITHLDIPPSLLTILDREAMPSTLKTIIIGGETCPENIVREWANKFRLINIYGPTEATVCTSMMQCNAQFVSASIGSPIANIDYHIMKKNFQPTSIGELYIAGEGLALGYLNNAALTQTKFITVNNKRYYKTGDRVKRDETSHYIYLGRMDRQVKICGQLVEPEEIEAALSQHPSVNNVAVIYKESEHRKQLLALVEAKNVTANILVYFLASRLPSWMIPNQIIIVDCIPKNTNGKTDYTLLQTMNVELKTQGDTQANNPIAQKLQHLWKEVLELPFLPSIYDDLFHTLGATSLDVIKFIVCSELQGLYFSTELINQLSTIDDLSAWIQFSNSPSTEFMPTAILKKECIRLLSNILAVSEAHGETERGTEGCHSLTPGPITQSSHILITGVTGFLGIHILDELLLKTDHPITCLVRAKNNDIALEKIKNIAIKYNLKVYDFIDRIHIILGDIALPQLGMTDKHWNHLVKTIGHIYHCAAEVNMSKSFAELKKTNLEGTKEIALFSLHTTKKRLYYISTLSVFVATDQNTGICSESSNLEDTQRVYGGYAQTKWAAEYFLQHSALDVTIFRLGLITGHSITGQSSAHDFLALFVNGLRSIGNIPKGAWDNVHFDATPVDFAARAIVYLSFHAPQNTFHIVNKHGFSLQMIINAMKKLGVHLGVTSCTDWLMETTPTTSMAASYMALCRLLSPQHDVFERFRSMDLFQATNIEFEQKNTLHHLANTGIFCPEADEILLNKYIARILYAQR